MKRSTGVTVSAILVFLGSGLTLIFGGLVSLALLLMRKTAPQPPLMRYILAFSIVVYLAFGVWGIASGIGLLRLRQWGRISVLVFSGILLFFAVPTLIIVPFMPMPEPPDSPGNIVLIIKIFMGCFYGALAAIGGGWLYFFNRRSVKDQFLSQPEQGAFALQTGTDGLTQVGIDQPTEKRSKRPLSITIIGWILLATGLMCLPAVFLRSPVLLLGYLLPEWQGSLFMLIWCGVQSITGWGLLQLRSWARSLSICLFLFGMLNGAATVLVPGAAARFAQVNVAMQARMGLPTTGPGTMAPEMTHFFLWFGAIFGMVFMAIPLWFVVTRKQAFSPTVGSPAFLP